MSIITDSYFLLLSFVFLALFVPLIAIVFRRLIIEDGVIDGLTMYRVPARVLRWIEGGKFFGVIAAPVERKPS